MNDAPELVPWSEACRDGDGPERRRFLESHLDLVRYLALRIASRLAGCVEVDDLIHDGILGLLDAATRFEPGRGVRFRTYAESRIRGAILDGLRQSDWRPRSVRRGRRELEEAAGRLAKAYGRAATEEEIAAAMGLDLDAYRSLLQHAATGPLLSLDGIAGDLAPPASGTAALPHASFERRELAAALAEEIERLPERERRVLELYYHEGLNMKEVGAVLGVTESRVCQLHAQAAARLRAALGERLHPAPACAGPARRHR